MIDIGKIEFCGCSSVGNISVFCAKHEPPHGKAVIRHEAGIVVDDPDAWYAAEVERMKERAPA